MFEVEIGRIYEIIESRGNQGTIVIVKITEMLEIVEILEIAEIIIGMEETTEEDLMMESGVTVALRVEIEEGISPHHMTAEEMKIGEVISADRRDPEKI